MNTKQENTNPAAAVDTPPPAPTLAPEAVVEQLRTLSGQIGEVAPLTAAQRKTLRKAGNPSNSILQSSISVIGALDVVAQAVGQPADDMRQLCDENNRWTAVEDQLRIMLNGVTGANLIRRQRIALVAGRAYNIGTQLARDPAHAVLVPLVQEIKRLKSFKRRKKAAPAPTPKSSVSGTSQSPASVTPQSQASGTPAQSAPATPVPAGK
jgi:hypothetical protein